jgi:archaemetzincin
VAVHEFGHNLGLPHCPNKKCVMTSAAEKLTTIDNEKLALCMTCKKIINYN